MNTTILILSHSHKHRLPNLLNYYKSASCEVVVLDEDKSFRVKILDGIEKVTTPYCVLCGEDDFISPKAIKKCVEFLESDPNYICATGLHTQHFPKFYWMPLYVGVASKHMQIFYAVYRTKSLLSIHRRINKVINSDFSSKEMDGTIEVLVGAYARQIGKVKILPIFYSSREVNVIGPKVVANHSEKSDTWYLTYEKKKRSLFRFILWRFYKFTYWIICRKELNVIKKTMGGE